SGFQSFPIDSRRVRGLDSRLRGNDGFRDCGVIGNDGNFKIAALSEMTGFKITGVVGTKLNRHSHGKWGI
ncbi:hypothetical protein, partial [Neisseria meningitidis]|uniref:hypothetical protein n=1 Tax=Neisseria meningitidis TaxID=487 RepID=UPI001E545197